MLKKLFLLSTVASLAAFPALAQESTQQPTTITPPAEQTQPAQPADQAPADMTQQAPAADPNAPATTDPAQPAEPATAEAEQPATPPPSEAVIPAQAAGDVRAGAMNRVASAVGEGAMAVRLVFDYLESH